jgi:hypothetical protein
MFTHCMKIKCNFYNSKNQDFINRHIV